MADVGVSLPVALERALELFEERPTEVRVRDGYVDLLGEQDGEQDSFAQRLMESTLVPRIYERMWRPFGMRLAMGLKGPGLREEQRMALRMLDLKHGVRVLDAACGPGNFSRGFAQACGEQGLVVGVDVSKTMLAVAVRDVAAANVAYMRADACALPFQPSVFGAVCCFAALHLMDPPMQALDEMLRVLAPGGWLALLASCDPKRAIGERTIGGVRIFGREELTGALCERGMSDIEQTVARHAQFVSARKPA